MLAHSSVVQLLVDLTSDFCCVQHAVQTYAALLMALRQHQLYSCLLRLTRAGRAHQGAAKGRRGAQRGGQRAATAAAAPGWGAAESRLLCEALKLTTFNRFGYRAVSALLHAGRAH